MHYLPSLSAQYICLSALGNLHININSATAFKPETILGSTYLDCQFNHYAIEMSGHV